MKITAERELDRLRALTSFSILDTPPERQFDEITRLASLALATQSAAISLIDDHRQWFKSRVGIPFTETPREQAFCTHPVASQQFFEVSDASQDPRFADNPLVMAPNGIRHLHRLWKVSLERTLECLVIWQLLA